MSEKRQPPSRTTSKTKGSQGQRTLHDLFTRKAKGDPQNRDEEGVKSELPLRLPLASVPATASTNTIDPVDVTSAPTAPGRHEKRVKASVEVPPIITRRSVSRPHKAGITSNEPAGPSVIDLTQSSPPRPLNGDPSQCLDPTAAPPPILRPLVSVFPIFAPTQARVNRIRAVSPQRREERNIPWPNSGSQHIRGLQTIFQAPPLAFARKSFESQRIPAADPPSLTNLRISIDHLAKATLQRATPVPVVVNLERTPDSVAVMHEKTYPAIARVAAAASNDLLKEGTSSQRLWTDEWCPSRANEVLGNESLSIYLRDWLRALEIQLAFAPDPVASGDSTANRKSEGKRKAGASSQARAMKRPRVLRGVERKRRRKGRLDVSDEEDDWIVSDCETEREQQLDSDDDDFGTHRKIDLKANGDASFPPFPPGDFHDTVTNAILLTGPSGCGKTASIYACANELNWEVFEVYPGIGKRSGASLDNLVGEVGKNHLVRKTQLGNGKTKDAFASLLDVTKNRKKKQPRVEGNGESATEPLNLELGDTRAASGDFGKGANSSRTTAHQSLVLLEEVDILFKEDVNFWPAVIHLIRNCRRPVVMTCNDLSLIPMHDLALQSVLKFSPCPAQVAASYLQGLCLAEGHFFERDAVMRLIESAKHVRSVDAQDAHLTAGELPIPDLRRAIHQLQLSVPQGSGLFEPQPDLESLADWGLPHCPADESPVKQKERMRAVLDHVELVSFVDCMVVRSPVASPESLAFNDCEPCADDELGHTMLFGPFRMTSRHEEPRYSHEDELIGQEIVKRSRERLVAIADVDAGLKVEQALHARGLSHSRVAYQEQVAGAINLIPSAGLFMSRSAVFLDYLPWIRQMVDLEDSQELESEKRGKPGRQTRNSNRDEWLIVMSEEDRLAFTRTAFRSGP